MAFQSWSIFSVKWLSLIPSASGFLISVESKTTNWNSKHPEKNSKHPGKKKKGQYEKATLDPENVADIWSTVSCLNEQRTIDWHWGSKK